MSSAVTEPDTRADLALALELADLADAITLPRFRAADLRVTRKPDRTPVTDADTAAEDALRAAIGGRRPGDAILGEEGGGTVGEGRGWVLDPIDGTKNFSRGMPVWASLIALCSGGVPVVGVVSAPALGRRWWAAARHGAWTSERGGEARRISVTGVTALEDAYLSTTNQETFREFDGMDRWLALSQACWETRAFGDFWQHCLVAEGAIDLAVEPAANPWDLAAVQVLLEEAGGRLTDLRGVPGFAGGDGLASNGHLHEAALRVLQSAE